MNAKKWIAHFETNRHAWAEPDWAADSPILSEKRTRSLVDSLATFQLGESGGGTRLKSFVAQSWEGSPDYKEAVDLFVAEEQYHAEILAKAVIYLNGELKSKHWMNSIFRKFRTLIGLEFNLQILLTAELIAEAYYGILAKHVPDPVIKSMCQKVLRDEVKHIAFHEEFFRLNQRRWLPISSTIWSLQFQAVFMCVERAVWLDHGKCLTSFGITKRDFRAKAQGVCRRFLNRVIMLPSLSTSAQAHAKM